MKIIGTDFLEEEDIEALNLFVCFFTVYFEKSSGKNWKTTSGYHIDIQILLQFNMNLFKVNLMFV